jgi:hypothetical protein
LKFDLEVEWIALFNGFHCCFLLEPPFGIIWEGRIDATPTDQTRSKTSKFPSTSAQNSIETMKISSKIIFFPASNQEKTLDNPPNLSTLPNKQIRLDPKL